jgi:hypothetical protein
MWFWNTYWRCRSSGIWHRVRWQSKKIMSWILRMETESSSVPFLFTTKHCVISWKTRIMSTTAWTPILVEGLITLKWRLTVLALNCQNFSALQSHLQKFSEWMKKCDDFVILICDYMHFALCTECVNVTLWICDMLHAGMCSCLCGFVFTLLVLVVFCMAL